MYPVNFDEDELAALFLCLNKIKMSCKMHVFNLVSPFEITLNMKYMYKIHIIVLFIVVYLYYPFKEHLPVITGKMTSVQVSPLSCLSHIEACTV